MTSIIGGTTIGESGYSGSCKNCGHSSHCGTSLREESWSSYGKRLGQIVICQSCRCDRCNDKDLKEHWKTL